MSTDAIVLLKEDHKEMRRLFKAFQDAEKGLLIENVTHHVEEEEQEWFPKVRDALGRKQLQEIGEKMIALRADAPRTPTAPRRAPPRPAPPRPAPPRPAPPHPAILHFPLLVSDIW
ncbi:hypothetical protein [Micromonospora sp. CPCC 205558]|uniref:hypothetical protein n=1 Tax=Micromonospora sp. CPCC 205558 TaxID=3122403 RepID=UPI002FF159A2